MSNKVPVHVFTSNQCKKFYLKPDDKELELWRNSPNAVVGFDDTELKKKQPRYYLWKKDGNTCVEMSDQEKKDRLRLLKEVKEPLDERLVLMMPEVKEVLKTVVKEVPKEVIKEVKVVEEKEVVKEVPKRKWGELVAALVSGLGLGFLNSYVDWDKAIELALELLK